MASSQLIPGLPNDLALQCLLCIPAKELVRMQMVSPLWRIVIQSDRFYMERRRRQAYPSIFVIRRTHDGYQCLDADTEDLKNPRHLKNPRLLFSCDLCEGKKLFPPDVVFTCLEANVYSVAPGHHVQKFSLLTRRWTPVSKLFPPKCKLMVSAFGMHVIVVAGSNISARDIVVDDENEALNTVCEILDTHTHQWACIEGLPVFFYSTHCFAYEGTFHVLGETRDGSIADYKLNWRKRQWEEDDNMSTLLKDLTGKDKIIIKPRTILTATDYGGMVKVRNFFVDTRTWMDVVKYKLGHANNIFLFRLDEQVLLAVPSEGSSWMMKTIPYYHGLKFLFVPDYELLLVDAIAG